MRRFILPLILLGLNLIALPAAAVDYVFEGPWNTTNRKLDGIMTCVMTEQTDEKWQGRFYGVWQGVAFDYTVAFTGPPEKLQGKAVIDGANYTWTGVISPGAPRTFQATFTGDRYAGYFKMKERSKAVATGR